MWNSKRYATFKKGFFIYLVIQVMVIIIAGGFYFYNYEKTVIRLEKYGELKAISELKINQLEQWLKERMGDAEVAARSPFFSKAVESWMKNPADKKVITDITDRLRVTKSSYNYEDIILASVNGKLMLSLTDSLKEIDASTARFIKTAVSKKSLQLSYLYRCTRKNTVHFDFLAPLIDKNHNVVAVLVLRVNPYDYLYPLIQSWPTPSKTSETVLVRKENGNLLFLNELRHKKNTALSFTIPLTRRDVPGVHAVLGYRGITEGRDYRGVEVLADIRSVPNTPWFMLAKVDREEIFSELSFRIVVIITFVVILIILAGGAVAWIYHYRQRNTFKQLFLNEKALRETQEEFRTTLYSIGDAVITTDTSGRIKQMNHIGEQLTGWKELECRGKSLEEVFKIIDEDTRSATANPFQRVLKEGTVVGLANHTLLISRDKKEIPIADSGSPIKNENGEIIGVVIVFRDQTEERAAQKILRASESRYRNTLDSMMEGCQIIGFDWRYLYVNDAAAKHGRSAKEALLNNKMVELYPGIENTEMFIHLKQCMEERVNHVMENHFVYPDGKQAWFELSIQPAPEGAFILSFDITARKQAEEEIKKLNAELENKINERTNELQDSLKFIETMVETSLTGLTVYDQSGQCIMTNKSMTSIIGATKEEVMRQNFHTINSWKESGLYKTAIEAIQLNEPRQIDTHFVTTFGKEVWLDCVLTPFISKNQTNLLLIMNDISGRLKKEEKIRELNKELQDQAERLEAANKELEAFSYSVSHDLRAPLRAVDGFTGMLVDEYKDKFDDEGQRICSVIQENAKKMGQLIDDLLAFSRLSRADIKITRIDMKTLANSVYHELTDEEARDKIDFIVHDIPPIDGDPNMIRQVWVNLISNAIKFSSKKEKPMIEISNEYEDQKVTYTVKDNGAGFSMKYTNKLFGVFQRLHSSKEFEGTGVGLAIVQRVINKHGGKVWAESEIDKGAAFFFSLPKQD